MTHVIDWMKARRKAWADKTAKINRIEQGQHKNLVARLPKARITPFVEIEIDGHKMQWRQVGDIDADAADQA